MEHPFKHHTFASTLRQSLIRSAIVIGSFFLLQWLMPNVLRAFTSLFTKAGILSHPYWVASVGTAFLLYIGYIASVFRDRIPVFFGMMEIVLGMLLGFNALLQLGPGFEVWRVLGIVAAIFVMAGGFHNIYEAKQKQLAHHQE